jgi:hypothetical protein
MNSIFAKLIGLLPLLICGAQQIGADVKGHQKKQAVSDALLAVAAGVGVGAPEHAQAAQAAAQTAINAIDGVVEVMKLTGALPVPVISTTAR